MMAHNLVTAWQRILSPRGQLYQARETGAAIHCYDPIDDFAAWTRCRDRGQFHLGRARRAKDRGHYHEAAREIERALKYDDTSEAYFQVLGQSLLHQPSPDVSGARRAFERAFALNPRNGYTIRLLADACLREGNPEAARLTIVRARAAGAPSGAWQPILERLGELSPVA